MVVVTAGIGPGVPDRDDRYRAGRFKTARYRTLTSVNHTRNPSGPLLDNDSSIPLNER
jgi:hypothetical protein